MVYLWNGQNDHAGTCWQTLHQHESHISLIVTWSCLHMPANLKSTLCASHVFATYFPAIIHSIRKSILNNIACHTHHREKHRKDPLLIQDNSTAHQGGRIILVLETAGVGVWASASMQAIASPANCDCNAKQPPARFLQSHKKCHNHIHKSVTWQRWYYITFHMFPLTRYSENSRSTCVRCRTL